MIFDASYCYLVASPNINIHTYMYIERKNIGLQVIYNATNQKSAIFYGQ